MRRPEALYSLLQAEAALLTPDTEDAGPSPSSIEWSLNSLGDAVFAIGEGVDDLHEEVLRLRGELADERRLLSKLVLLLKP